MILLFFLLAARAQIVPEFNCWFTTYQNATRVTNLVFSYNNTQNGSDVTLPAGTADNLLWPAGFNGQQPDIFKAGNQAFALVLTDEGGVLAQGGAIGWALDNATVNVTAVQLTPQLQCDTAYHGLCPDWVAGFCDDGVYCNGQETCVSMGIGVQSVKTMGACANMSQGVQCAVNARCVEEAVACVALTDAPTVAPTAQPTEAPTDSPTLAPVAEIVPLFYCWFESTEVGIDGPVVNLAVGYNNSADVALTRPVTATQVGVSANCIAPSLYNGHQSTLFQPGYEPLSYVVKDTAGVLRQNGTISWRLTAATLTLDASLLTPSAECSVLLPPTAPGDDTEVVAQCSLIAPNCTAYDTYCHGTTTCNFTTSQCDPVDPSYNPCAPLESQVSPPSYLVCIEALQQCQAYVNCTTDAQCNNGQICDGREYCVINGSLGTCMGQANLTIAELCGTPNAVCIEGVGCESTTAVSPRTTVAIAFGVIVAAAVVLIFLYFLFSGDADRPAKMKKQR